MFSKTKIITLIVISLFSVLGFTTQTHNVYAQNEVATSQITNSLGEASDIKSEARELKELNTFSKNFSNLFITPSTGGGEGFLGTMVYIAFQIKNFFIAIAVIFLIVGVLTLLFSEMDTSAAKKWRNNIIWVSVGIVVMQIAFGAWNALLVDISKPGTGIGSALSWNFWSSILAPLVRMIQMLAGFVFIVMMIYAFYTIVMSGGEESGRKKGINMVIYSLIGFLLLRIPDIIVSSFYTNLPQCGSGQTFGFVNPCSGRQGSDFSAIIGAVGTIIQWINGLLAVICVILVLYAGFLILTSRGEEEKLKKARRIILYIIVGIILLLLSHAIFRFFILK